jgi:protein TonB
MKTILTVFGLCSLGFSLAQEKDSTIEETQEHEIWVDPIQIDPQFPGGQAKLFEFIGQNIKYPQAAVDSSIQGKVYVGFMIDTLGNVKDVSVLKGIEPELDAEALRVIQSMPKWTPGQLSGKKVNIRYTLPIIFKLD